MIVIARDNIESTYMDGTVYANLTKHKEYDVEHITFWSGRSWVESWFTDKYNMNYKGGSEFYIVIRDDNNKECSIWNHEFLTTLEMRDLKLNNLLCTK